MSYDKTISSIKLNHPFIHWVALNHILVQRGTTCSDRLTNFIWNKTKEGQEIWSEVSRDNYEPFYKFHNRVNPLIGIPSVTLKIYNK